MRVIFDLLSALGTLVLLVIMAVNIDDTETFGKAAALLILLALWEISGEIRRLRQDKS